MRRAGGWSWGRGSPAFPALRGNGGGLGVGLSQGPGVGPGQLAMEPSHRNRHTQVTERHSFYWTWFPHTYLLQTPLALSQLAPTTFPQIPGLLCLVSAFLAILLQTRPERLGARGPAHRGLSGAPHSETCPSVNTGVMELLWDLWGLNPGSRVDLVRALRLRDPFRTEGLLQKPDVVWLSPHRCRPWSHTQEPVNQRSSRGPSTEVVRRNLQASLGNI